MLKKIMHGATALALVVGIAAASAQPAEAHRRGVGAGLAIGTILGLGIAGAYAGPRYYYDDYGPACYRGPRQCDYVGRSCWYNSYGERVCRGGEYRCWRPTVCD
jgi:hypothetical protein